MTADELAKSLYKHPERIGIAVGFKDLTEMHGDWIRSIVFSREDYTLMAHRAAYKSSCMAVGIALLMVLKPTKNIIFLRKADSDVSEMLRMVKKILLSDVFANIVTVLYGVPLSLTEDAVDRISTNLWQSPMGAPQLLGLGIRSSITGKHAEFVITDDICNVSDRISKAERDRTKLQYQELQNIRNRGGRIINLGTKWHKDDVFTLMPNIEVYDYRRTGLIPEEKIAELKASMTAALFAANYELKIVAADDVIFDEPETGADISTIMDADAHIDAAYGGEDYTAYTAFKKKNGKYYLYGKLWRKHVDDVESEIVRIHESIRGGKIYCENNGDKGYLAKDLRRRGMRCVVYHEKQNKFMKITSYLKSVWKDVIFVEGTDKEYIAQICDYNENAEHDDAPDSAACAVRRLWNKNSESNYTPLWL